MSWSESTPGNPLELILSKLLEGHLSCELSRFKSPRFFLSLSWFKSIFRVEWPWVGSPQKGHTKSTLEWKDQKRSYRINSKVECSTKVIRNWEWTASLSHELIRIKMLKSFFWVVIQFNSIHVFSTFHNGGGYLKVARHLSKKNAT